jgi:hypothetical protein
MRDGETGPRGTLADRLDSLFRTARSPAGRPYTVGEVARAIAAAGGATISRPTSGSFGPGGPTTRVGATSRPSPPSSASRPATSSTTTRPDARKRTPRSSSLSATRPSAGSSSDWPGSRRPRSRRSRRSSTRPERSRDWPGWRTASATLPGCRVPTDGHPMMGGAPTGARTDRRPSTANRRARPGPGPRPSRATELARRQAERGRPGSAVLVVGPAEGEAVEWARPWERATGPTRAGPPRTPVPGSCCGAP